MGMERRRCLMQLYGLVNQKWEEPEELGGRRGATSPRSSTQFNGFSEPDGASEKLMSEGEEPRDGVQKGGGYRG
jgi:hypothetical protein